MIGNDDFKSTGVMRPCEPAVRLVDTCGLRGFQGGVDFLWMRASFDQNVAMIIDPPVGNRLVPFDYEFSLRPRAWLSWQIECGRGVRASYFRFDEAARTESAAAVPGATPVYLFVSGAGGNLSRNAYADLGETLVSNHRLQIQSLDLEATQRTQWSSLTALVGFGLRLADMEQHLRADGYQPGGILEEAVTNDLSFVGAGPTVSLQVNRGFFAAPIGLYGNARGSLLVAHSEQQIYEMKNAGANELVDVAEQREVLTNLELGVGLQYSQCIHQRLAMYCRAGHETQVWFDAGGPVDSRSTMALDGFVFSVGTLY